MWFFNKTYWADDWKVVGGDTIKILGDIGEHTGWALKVLLRNRKTGQTRMLYLGKWGFGYASMHDIRDKLFTKHGITWDLGSGRMKLSEKP